MSGTLKVKDLIKELLEFDMDDEVFIAMGALKQNAHKAQGASSIAYLGELGGNGTINEAPYGCYIVPSLDLVEVEE